MNNDMFNIFIAEKILQQFKPELLVVNMQGVDVCHFNFTNYCDNLRKADYALAHLWNTIQNIPGLANDTILIAVPEHGRNASPNTVMDAYGRYAVDHTGEQMSREIFCLVLGPAGVVKQNQVITSVTGESIDVVPTIADILGFYTDIPSQYSGNMGSPLAQAFV
jgi:arylsulfatase A-like enzyme